MSEQEEFEFRARFEAEQATPKKKEELANPTGGMSTFEKLAAGAGQGMTSAVRAVRQAAGFVSPQQAFYNQVTDLPGQIAEAKRLDAPLLDTTAGKVGSVAGNVAMAAPMMMVPGANTLLGASLGGAAFGGLTTEGGAKERTNAALSGGLGGALGVGLGKGVGLVADRVGASRAAAQVANAGKDAAAQNALSAGYKLPPTEVNPSMLNSALEGLSGKIKTSQSASTANQKVTNDLVKTELGLPKDAPITADVLNNIRATAGQAYDVVAKSGTVKPTPAYEQALDAITAQAKKASAGFPNAKPNPVIAEIESLKTGEFDASAAVAKIKELRAESSAAYAKQDKEMGKALKAGANALEDALDTHLTTIGAPAEVLKNFRDSRALIAKTYSVQGSLVGTSGDVSAAKLAAQLAKGRPLSGNLKTVAEVNQNFPKATQTLSQSYNALSPLDYMAGVMSAGATGLPGAAATLARPAVRNVLMSGPYQRSLGAPSYTQNRLLELLNRNPLLPVAGMNLIPADK